MEEYDSKYKDKYENLRYAFSVLHGNAGKHAQPPEPQQRGACTAQPAGSLPSWEANYTE